MPAQAPPRPTDELTDMIKSAIESGQSYPTPMLKFARLNPRLSKRAQAFEVFMHRTDNLSEVARIVGCTRQYVYHLHRQDKWEEKRHTAQVTAEMSAEEIGEHLMKSAIGALRARVHDRIRELNELCITGNLKAILAWLSMAGVGKEEEGPPVPPVTEIVNDLSDRRQITVVTQASPDPPALLEGEP